MIRLNIGSGQRKFGSQDCRHGWINIDVNPKWEPDIVADGAHLPMYEDGTVDMIVLHHVLEHYGCGESAGLIEECHRILRPGGTLLVFVPDMWALAFGWLHGRVMTQIFMTAVYGAYMDHEADRHRWGFDSVTIKKFLGPFGFRLKEFDWRDILGADLARDWWLMGIEATK